VYGNQSNVPLSLTEATALLSLKKPQPLSFHHENLERCIAQLELGAEVRG